MKFSKVCVLSVALLGATSSAQAAFDLPNTGNGSLAFLAFDSATGASLAVDLGLTYSDLVTGSATDLTLAPNNSFSFSQNLSAAFNAVFPSTVGVQWGLIAADNELDAGCFVTECGRNMVMTSANPAGPAGVNASMLVSLNTLNGFMDELAGEGGTTVSEAATAAPSLFNINFRLGSNFDGAGPTYSGDVGSSLGLFLVETGDEFDIGNGPEQVGGSPSTPYVVTQFAFDALFDGSTLEINAAPIPLPAAVWLFGAGLLGMFGFSRRQAA